ncbi:MULTISPECIES: siderophore-interacting protein [Streptomyces]|uniref:siderophore-interacting protein n=1 Tax=Streptomyces TaxID=1883 RepID=UPI000F795A53|nr:siderophore-interacting protein [Streptomyces sp. WAC02707]RSS97411.1 siderophore-interacting protein [Streptomyces sp. WAC02707]
MPQGAWVLERLLQRATATVAEPAGDRWRRIRLQTAGPLDWKPGHHIRVQVAPLSLRSPRDLLRTYTVWDYTDNALELRVFEHGEGPGARWARELAPGSEVMFKAPEGRFTVRPDAPDHLFIGEETASVAIGAMARSLHGRCRALIAVDDVADQIPIEGDVQWIQNGTALAPDTRTLVQAVAALPDIRPGTVAYIAGEAQTCQAVKRHLLHERGWPRRDIVVKPFWTPGKRGMD